MKTIHLFQRRIIIGILMLMVFASAFTGCTKSTDVTPETPTETLARDADKVPYYKLQRVENLAAETDDQNPTAPKIELLFSLDYKKVQPDTYAKTTFWDLSFSSSYNSFLGGNNNTNAANSGYQGAGKGGITVVMKAFDEVTDVPVDADLKTGKGIVGTDFEGAFAETPTTLGWYMYDFGGTKVGDGSAEKLHVAYAMGNPLKLANGTSLTPRTVILKTANGDYAKIKMISCYKDAFTQDKMFKSTPHMYFTFEYIIVPAGSTKFEIR